jgi:hypothetical protein
MHNPQSTTLHSFTSSHLQSHVLDCAVFERDLLALRALAVGVVAWERRHVIQQIVDAVRIGVAVLQVKRD